MVQFKCNTPKIILPIAMILLVGFSSNLVSAVEEGWIAGAAKTDVTPQMEVRLSGYAVRKEATKEVADRLFARALAMRYQDKPWMIIVSIDTIGMPASLTDRISVELKNRYQLERRQVVFCGTHSHYTPHLVDSIPNLFDLPLSDKELAASEEYTQQLMDGIIDAIGKAIQKAEPSKVSIGEGMAGFALNRRPPAGPNATAENPGPVDRSVRVLRVANLANKEIAIAYQYACHCTTIPASDNKISSDWAGLSAASLEKDFAGAIALPIIGCGADANPTPRGTYELAQKYGTELAAAVKSVCKGSTVELPPPDRISFDFVALSSERPSRERLQEMLQNPQPQQQRFAASMIEIWNRRGRIPETYPEPVHLWRFGKDLTWIFMGGEVVVDYQLRLAKEIQNTSKVWVAGYTDDVFAYVASERLRGEGGYEVDTSMLYYNRPGRWEAGTEQLLVDRIVNQSQRSRDPDEAIPSSKALESIHVAAGLQVGLMATDPMVEDPINIAFDAQGRVWVLEMGDYPLGLGEGKPRLGKVKIGTDEDGNGTIDKVTVFLDGLEYASGVYPWGDGAIIASVPDVFWARDTNGDGVADSREVLITGFPSVNPQHRVHGFTYGLDHRLHFGVGEDARQITTPRDGKVWNVAGCDISLDVEKGTIQLESGKTQYIRGRDDWGNWFGNDNIHPIFQYVIEDRYQRLGQRLKGPAVNHLMHPETAPPVFPLLRSADRYNDVHTANCYTSACSSIICRGTGLGKEMEGAALVCEPVHNMVGRARVVPAGASMQGVRFDDDSQSEWFRSDDPWSRPVRVENAPDGSLWVVDMYRRVIEHPEWIPEEWQARIDLRAGQKMGRLYRVAKDRPARTLPNVMALKTSQLLSMLSSPEGALRDLVQQQLIARNDPQSIDALQTLATNSDSPHARLHAYAILRALGKLGRETVSRGFKDPDPRILKMLVRWSEEVDGLWDEEYLALSTSTKVEASQELSLQLLLSTLNDSDRFVNVQTRLLSLHGDERWHRSATDLLPTKSVDSILNELINGDAQKRNKNKDLGNLLGTLMPRASVALKGDLLGKINTNESKRPAWHYTLATGLRKGDADFDEEVMAKILSDARKEAARIQLSVAEVSDLALAAVQLLSSVSSIDQTEDIEAFTKLTVHPDDALSLLAMEGLLRTGREEVLSDLFKKWKALSPRLQSKLLSQVMLRGDRQIALLESIEKGLLSIRDLDPSTIEHWESIKDPVQRERFAKLVTGDKKPVKELISNYESKLPLDGNIEKGKALFDRHCALCHRDSKNAQAVGPNLSALNEWTNSQWIVAVLDPNRSVEGKYRRLKVVKDDGSLFTGLLRSETDSQVEITLADGTAQTIDKSEIESIDTTDQSLMPEGFERFLNAGDLRDIVEYLRQR